MHYFLLHFHFDEWKRNYWLLTIGVRRAITTVFLMLSICVHFWNNVVVAVRQHNRAEIGVDSVHSSNKLDPSLFSLRRNKKSIVVTRKRKESTHIIRTCFGVPFTCDCYSTFLNAIQEHRRWEQEQEPKQNQSKRKEQQQKITTEKITLKQNGT